jgi:hypothetical protein
MAFAVIAAHNGATLLQAPGMPIMLHIKDLEAFARINAAIAGHDDEAPLTHEEREHRRIAAAHLFMRLAGATLRRPASKRPADSTAEPVGGRGGEDEAQDLAAQLTEAAVNVIAAAAAEGEKTADLASPHSQHGPLGLMQALAKQRDEA